MMIKLTLKVRVAERDLTFKALAQQTKITRARSPIWRTIKR